jgi:hypothetical protein
LPPVENPKNPKIGPPYAACMIFRSKNGSYLGELEAEFETELKKALASASGPQVVLLDEKKPKVKNLVALSL